MGVQWFNERGVAFAYPLGWTVQVEPADDMAAPAEATVYHNSGAFWSVALHAPNADLEGLVKAAREALDSEYEGVEVEPVAEAVGEYSAVGFDANFWSLDLTNTARLRCVSTPAATFVIYSQCEDRDLPAVEPAFRDMTESLLEHAVDEDDDEV